MLNWRKDKEADGSGSSESGSRLGDVLVEEGLVSAGQVADGLKKAEADGTFLGQALVDANVIRQNDFTTCLVKKCKIPHLSLLDYEISDDLVSLVSKEVCQQYHLVPIDKMGKILTVAMVDPLDEEALTVVREACPDLRIKPILCDWHHYRQVTMRQFGGESKGKQQEVSMASLGLGAAKPKAAPPPEPKVEAPVGEGAVAQGVAPETPPAAAASAGIAPEVLTQALRDAVRESLGNLGHEIREAMASRPAGGEQAALPMEEFGATLQTSLKSALQEALGAVVQEVRASHAPSAAESQAPAGPSAHELAGVFQESMRSVVEEVMAAAAQRHAASQPAPVPMAGDLAAAVQESVSAALRDTMGGLAEEIRQSRQTVPHGDAAHNVESIAQALIEALTPTAEAMREAAESIRHASLSGQGGGEGGSGLSEAASQIMRAAEAAIEATRAAEALHAARAEETEQERQERIARFTTVRPFGEHADGDADARVMAALDADCPLEGFSFNSFCISKSNEFTAKMCQAIAAKPGAEHNPFFLYGAVGVGKTHLINATGHAIHEADTSRRIGYVSAGRFAEKLLEARQARASDVFREVYSHWDVLILDDIQFLGGALEAQEEFFHIFNALHQAGRQIIIAADKAPDRLGQLEQRLVSRFAGGIVAPLDPPDHECRMAILRKQAEVAKLKLGEDVLAVVATRMPGDVRRLVGALRKVIAFGSLVGQDITSDMAYNVLGHLGAPEAAH